MRIGLVQIRSLGYSGNFVHFYFNVVKMELLAGMAVYSIVFKLYQALN